MSCMVSLLEASDSIRDALKIVATEREPSRLMTEYVLRGENTPQVTNTSHLCREQAECLQIEARSAVDMPRMTNI